MASRDTTSSLASSDTSQINFKPKGVVVGIKDG